MKISKMVKYILKKTRLVVGLFIMFSLVILSVNEKVYAEEQIRLTREMLGDNNTLLVVRLTRRVVDIEDGAFSGLTALKEIRVDTDNEYFASCNGCLYNKDYTVLICVPQNTKSVSVKRTIKSCWPHALDGLDQSRIDKFNEIFGVPYVKEPITLTENQPVDRSEVQQRPVNNQTPAPTVSNPMSQPKNRSNDFSQYVYNEDGEICFKYTGTGNSRIIVPEGVQKITGFSADHFEKNYEITYIYIPSSVTRIRNGNIFNTEENNWDNNGYLMLYQCPNLKTVESASPYWQVDSNGLYQPLANGGKAYQWSPNQILKYDRDIYYSSGSIVDSSGKKRDR